MSGEWGEVLGLVGAALAMAPAMLVLAGVGTLLVGVGPRWAPLTWGFLAWSVAVGLLGGVLGLPQWALDLSPFEHVPALPVDSVSWAPIALLMATAGGLIAVGLHLLNRRDIA